MRCCPASSNSTQAPATGDPEAVTVPETVAVAGMVRAAGLVGARFFWPSRNWASGVFVATGAAGFCPPVATDGAGHHGPPVGADASTRPSRTPPLTCAGPARPATFEGAAPVVVAMDSTATASVATHVNRCFTALSLPVWPVSPQYGKGCHRRM